MCRGTNLLRESIMIRTKEYLRSRKYPARRFARISILNRNSTVTQNQGNNKSITVITTQIMFKTRWAWRVTSARKSNFKNQCLLSLQSPDLTEISLASKTKLIARLSRSNFSENSLSQSNIRQYKRIKNWTFREPKARSSTLRIKQRHLRRAPRSSNSYIPTTCNPCQLQRLIWAKTI